MVNNKYPFEYQISAKKSINKTQKKYVQQFDDRKKALFKDL